MKGSPAKQGIGDITKVSPISGPLLQQKVLQVGFPIADVWIEIFDLLGNHRHDHFHPWGFCRIREG